MGYRNLPSDTDLSKFYGHSPNEASNAGQLLFDHIHGGTETQEAHGVALMARAFAKWFGMEERAFLAGLLHDLGKYSPTFTRHMMGAHLKLDHWTAGAWVAFKEYRAVDVALAIEGHHLGLQKGLRSNLGRLYLVNPILTMEKGLQLTETDDPDAKLLQTRWQQDLVSNKIPIPKPFATLRFLDGTTDQSSEMLAVRMLFSTLVDADFRDTERHFADGKKHHIPRPDAPKLDAPRALAQVRQYLADLPGKSKTNPALQALRQSLGDDCTLAAQGDDLLYTLTAPTGSGKTLAMLLFALERAVREPGRFRRIVIALPYLSLLDQTAKIYHELFPAPEFGDHYVLEHHSLAGTTREGAQTDTGEAEIGKSDDARQNEARMLTENWDAPIILTTNVQLFESLHANRPSACRKLHNLSGSIILCDEVQTLPVSLAIPTLRTLSGLATPTYNAAVVFATATQPAFNALSDKVAEDRGTRGWTPREIVSDPPALFKQAAALRTVHADWSQVHLATSWQTVAEWLSGVPQAMAIVNMRRHSVELAKLLAEAKVPGFQYLSTYLCPAHRREVLGRVNDALHPEDPKPCHLVATQCVEAGVDLDFPLVCRALAPLDSIAQAAGRCNRHGAMPSGGTLRVFLPDDDPKRLYPDDGYKQAAKMTADLARNGVTPDITNPDEFARYFSVLYALNDVAGQEKDVHKAIHRLDFVDTAKHYQLIDKRGINVVVPYKGGIQLGEEILKYGLNRDRMRAARQFTVSIFTNTRQGVPLDLTPVSYARGADAPDWFVLTYKTEYDTTFGYIPKDDEIGYSPRSGSHTV